MSIPSDAKYVRIAQARTAYREIVTPGWQRAPKGHPSHADTLCTVVKERVVIELHDVRLTLNPDGTYSLWDPN